MQPLTTGIYCFAFNVTYGKAEKTGMENVLYIVVKVSLLLSFAEN
jgi:hypothetical protein